MNKQLIIGGGRLGQAIAQLLAVNNQIDVYIWDVDPDKCLPKYSSFDQAIQSAEAIFFCAPVNSLAKTLITLRQYNIKYFYCLAKGVESESLFDSQDILNRYAKNLKWAILSGPMIAEELEQPTSAVVATNQKEVFDYANMQFDNSTLALKYSCKTDEVVVGGILKNVYAVLGGLIEELNLSENVAGIVLGKSIQEALKVAEDLSFDQTTMLNESFLFDYIATVTSSSSTHRLMGKKIVLQQLSDVKEISESILYFKHRLNKLYPILELIEVINTQKLLASEIKERILSFV